MKTDPYKASLQEVSVRIDEPRKDGSACQIDDPRRIARGKENLLLGPNSKDPPTPHGDRIHTRNRREYTLR